MLTITLGHLRSYCYILYCSFCMFNCCDMLCYARLCYITLCTIEPEDSENGSERKVIEYFQEAIDQGVHEPQPMNSFQGLG